jgi:hypothetical protein
VAHSGSRGGAPRCRLSEAKQTPLSHPDHGGAAPEVNRDPPPVAREAAERGMASTLPA